MLQAHHNKCQRGKNSFSSDEELGEIISVLYKKIHGMEISNVVANTSLNFNIDDTLEVIDRVRSPLAIKRLEGDEFSEIELDYLRILDSLTDQLFSRLVEMPDETIDIKLALQQARNVAGIK